MHARVLWLLVELDYAGQVHRGGATYTAPPSPMQLVATFPYPYVPDHDAAVGYGKPSNIVVKDGYYDAMLLMYTGQTGQYRDQRGGMRVVRTDNLADPTSWRGWNGADYTVQFSNPYRLGHPQRLGRGRARRGSCIAFNVPAGVVVQYADGTQSQQTFGPAQLPRVCMADFGRR